MDYTEVNNFANDRWHIYFKEDSEKFIPYYTFLIERHKSAGTITQPEYKFLCWLNHNNPDRFPVPFNTPHVPTPLLIDHQNLVTLPFFNDRRMELYNKFRSYLCDLNYASINSVPFYDYLIGGSFADASVKTPSDIDFALLIDQDDMYVENTHNTLPGNGPRLEIDAYFISKECSPQHYNSYIKLAILGNTAAIKDKDAMDVSDNTFKARTVYRLTNYF